MITIADLTVSEREELVYKRLEKAASKEDPDTHRYPSDEECDRIEKRLRKEFLLDVNDSSVELPHTD